MYTPVVLEISADPAYQRDWRVSKPRREDEDDWGMVGSTVSALLCLLLVLLVLVSASYPWTYDYYSPEPPPRFWWCKQGGSCA